MRTEHKLKSVDIIVHFFWRDHVAYIAESARHKILAYEIKRQVHKESLQESRRDLDYRIFFQSYVGIDKLLAIVWRDFFFELCVQLFYHLFKSLFFRREISIVIACKITQGLRAEYLSEIYRHLHADRFFLALLFIKLSFEKRICQRRREICVDGAAVRFGYAVQLLKWHTSLCDVEYAAPLPLSFYLICGRLFSRQSAFALVYKTGERVLDLFGSGIVVVVQNVAHVFDMRAAELAISHHQCFEKSDVARAVGDGVKYLHCNAV